jgi:glycosyltransferase involved in cell wall biosynthesis
MRITFVLAEKNLSGGCRAVAAHANNLFRRGHEVLIVATRPTPSSFRLKVRSLWQGKGWPSTIASSASHFDGIPVPSSTLPTPRPITENDLPDADVVIATWWETAEWVAQLPPSKGAKFYFIQHYEADLGQPVSRVDATWRLPLRKITCSQWLGDLARIRFEDREAIVVLNGVDREVFFSGSRVKQPVPTFGFLYSMNPSKRCDVSLRAFSMAAVDRPGIRLVAFGAEPVSPRLPLPRGAGFHLCPTQKRIREIYTSCDAWLFGSDSEGFGLPVLEAMACGTPVIGTRAGAGLQFITDRTGIAVGFNDPRGMADAIIRIHDTPMDQWVEMSEAARVATDEHTWEKSTAKFESALFLATGRPVPC